MEKGFYTALGTPLDENGNFIPGSMARQIEQQIEAGASGLLVMGSMGQMTYIKQDEYAKVAAESVKAAKDRIPVLVGVTDVSIHRVMDRVEALKDIDGIDGIVSTVPYYATVTQDNIYDFYNEIANRSGRHTYLYDLAVVTKTATAPATVKRLWKNPLIKGIKSGNLVTQRILHRAEDRPEDFTMMYSNIDDFDIAYKWGINKCLDGMCSCTPVNSGKMFRAMEQGDYTTAAECLNNIVALRDAFLGWDLWPAYSTTMNLLGYEGSHGLDYCSPIKPEFVPQIREKLEKIGEL